MGGTINSGDHPEMNIGNLAASVINPGFRGKHRDLLLRYKS